MPGNPFAALVAAHTLFQPLLAGLTGQALAALPVATVTGAVRASPGLTRLVPVRWRQHTVHAVDGAHAGFLGPAATADALAVITPGWQAGQHAELLTMTRY